jgi:hypothetical protein
MEERREEGWEEGEELTAENLEGKGVDIPDDYK